MLKEMIADGLLQANGIVGFYPCNSRDDDILIYSPDQGINSEPISVFHGLRQQVQYMIFVLVSNILIVETNM